MTYREARELRHRNHEQRKREHEARKQRIADLWPLMSVRWIAVEMDMTAQAVMAVADSIGLPSRPIGADPS